MQKFLIL
jgi:hypothetical protein